MLDAICPVRAGDNEELRYARRSWLQNLPMRRLVTAGGRPSWLGRGHDHMDVLQDGSKHRNAWRNLRALLHRKDLTENVIVLMDDVFVTEPVAEVPSLRRGFLAEVIADYRARRPDSQYTAAMVETKLLLERWGIRQPHSYALHMPMVVNRPMLTDLLDRLERELEDRPAEQVCRFQWRTLYGNLYVEDAEYRLDCKVYDLDEHPWPAPFLSTDDPSFRDGAVGQYIRELFPDRAPYEAR